MVDGFGWFEEADYRRSWLFFDDVVYVIPEDTKPPLGYPPQLFHREDCRAVRPAFTKTAWQTIGDAARRDAASTELRRIVAQIPQRDLDYACFVTACDRPMADALGLDRHIEPAFAIALLLEKLLVYAHENGLVPIVGRNWARRLLETKLTRPQPPSERALLSPAQGIAYDTFSAGLSLDFVDDAKLGAIAFDKLESFKHTNRQLLERHQVHLSEVTQQFQALPNSSERARKLAELKLAACKQRIELETSAHESVLTLGLDLLKKGAESVTSKEGIFLGATAALVVDKSLGALVGGALVAGAGQVVSGLVELWKSDRERVRTNSLAYLFAAQDL